MDSELYADLTPTYQQLLLDDIDGIIEGLTTDKAHVKQLEFRFNLFKKNFDSFQSLFSETSTVIDPGKYNDFIADIKAFIAIVETLKAKQRLTDENRQQLVEVAHEFQEMRYYLR